MHLHVSGLLLAQVLLYLLDSAGLHAGSPAVITSRDGTLIAMTNLGCAEGPLTRASHAGKLLVDVMVIHHLLATTTVVLSK